MFKSLTRVFLAVIFVITSLFVSYQPAQAGATIGGEVTLHEENFLSIFVQSTIHIQIWGYSGVISEQDFNDVIFIENLDQVQYFKLSSLYGEEIGLWNNTKGQWNNRGDNTWHRANAQFTLHKAGDNRLWAMFSWSPFRDMRGTATAVNLKVTFPKGIQVNYLPECVNGCIQNFHLERGSSTGVATSWNVIPLHGGNFTIELDWQEEGGIYPEHGSNIITVQKNFEVFLPLITR